MTKTSKTMTLCAIMELDDYLWFKKLDEQTRILFTDEFTDICERNGGFVCEQDFTTEGFSELLNMTYEEHERFVDYLVETLGDQGIRVMKVSPIRGGWDDDFLSDKVDAFLFTFMNGRLYRRGIDEEVLEEALRDVALRQFHVITFFYEVEYQEYSELAV